MASKEDLSEQLTITTKLAAAVQQMAANADKLDASYKSQLDSMTKMTAYMTQMSGGDVAKTFEEINKALQDMQTQMAETGKSSEKNLSTLGKAALDLGNTFGVKFPKQVTIGAAALSGFGQGIKNVVAMTKGIVGFFASFVDGAVNIGAAIIAIPFKIFEGLIDFAAKSMTGISELAQAMEELRKQFGAFYGPTNKAIIGTSISLKGFSDTGLSAWRVFGTMAERLTYIRELVTEMGTSFNLLRKEFENNGGAILAYQKGLGLTGESMKAVTQRSDMMGSTAGDTLKDMTKYSYALGKALQLDAKVISREMGEAMKDMAHFGTTSTKSLGESVAFAHKFGLELKDITGTLDKFDSFDDAAEHAANLSQAFGVNVDAFEMMKAAAEGDVGKQTELLRKAFREQGVDASKFNNVQRALIRDNTGMTDSAIQSAFSLKKQGVSLTDVKKAGDKAQASTMTQTQAMAQLSDAIERMVKAGGTQHGGFWDQFVQGFLNGIQATKPFYTMMISIKQALIQTMLAGVQAGKAFVKYFPGVSEMFENIGAAMKPIVTLFRTLRDELKKLFEGGINVSQFLDNMKTHFDEFLDNEKGPLSGILGGFKKFMSKMSEIIGAGIKYLVKHLTEALKEGTKFLSDPKKYLAAAQAGGAAGGAGLKFVMEILQPLIDAVKDPKMWEDLWTAFKDFAGTFWDLLKEKAIKPLLAAIPASFWLSMAAIFFGPAVGRAFLGVGINIMGGIVKEMIVGAMGKAAADKAASSAVQSMLENSVESGTKAAGPGISSVLWSRLVSFIATVPSAAAAAGAAAIGAALSAIAVAAVAAYATNTAAAMQKEATSALSKAQLQIASASGGNVSLIEKQRALGDIDAQIKAREDALKERKSGIKGYLDEFREAFELAANPNHTTTDDQLARLKREREDFGAQVEKLNVEQAKKLEASDSKKRILDAMGPVTIENAADRFKKVGDLATKLMGKDFNIGDKIKEIKDKLENIDFSIFKDKSKEDQVNQTLSTLESIKALVGTIADIGALSAKAKASLTGAASLQSSIEGFTSMVNNVVITITNPNTGLSGRLALLAASIDPVATNASKFSSLDDAFKSLANINTTLKSLQTGAMTNEQRAQSSTSILGLVNTINLVVTDLGGMKVTAESLKGLGNASDMFASLADTATMYRKMSDTVVGATKNIGKNAIGPALEAVNKMVQVANDLNSALADGNLNKIDIKAKLENVARAVGLGGKASYSVDTGKNIVITVNMTVTMDAASVEKAIIYNSKSIITDRLNFATSQPATKALDNITPGVDAQYPVKAATQ